MSTLAFDAQVDGVDEAVGQLARVDQAAGQVAQNTTRRFGRTVQEIRDEIEWTEAIEAAKKKLGRETERVTTATTATGTAVRRTGASVQEMASRVAGAGAAVAALSGALGASTGNRAAGLVTALANTVAQGAAMGATFGPGGAVVGGILGLVPLVTQLSESHRQAQEAAERHMETLRNGVRTIDDYVAAIRRQNAELRQRNVLDQGLGSVEEQQAATQQARDQLRLQEARVEAIRNELAAARESHSFFSDATDRIAEVTDRLAEAEGLRETSANFVADAMERERQAREDIAALADEDAGRMMESLLAPGAPGAPPSPRTGGGASRTAAPSGPTLDQLMLSGPRRPGGDVISGINGEAEAARAAAIEAENAARDAQKDKIEEIAQASREAAEAQRELANEAKEAQEAFSTGWTDSIDQVREAWIEANAALKTSGSQMMNQSRLMERTMVAVGNNIADTVGGTMTSAFETALGAWLDGSQSFVEAAEGMVKGVIKALVMESIVQAVVSIARGISALASQDYVAAPQHFAAAAAWAAVAGVAGGVGAGIGAFGGGDKKDAGGADKGDARSMGAGSVREEAAQQNVVINVFPGGFTTRGEVVGGVMQALDEAARTGFRIDSRLIRGT